MSVVLLLMVLLRPATGFAWGEEGHRIVGLIAEHYLTPVARHEATALLAQDASGLANSTSIADESVWADRYRDSDRNGNQIRYRQTQAWHYADLEIDHPDIHAACANRDCIVDKIVEFKKMLANPAASAQDRLLALQFLLHLVGDLHQPLHAADEHDRGGNDVHVKGAAERGGNLHHYWDSVFVTDLGAPSEVVAQRLIAGISPEQLRNFATGSVVNWAYESFGVAQREVYGKLPSADAQGVRTLDAEYTRNATATVALQLQRAGVRLAATLNEVLR